MPGRQWPPFAKSSIGAASGQCRISRHGMWLQNNAVRDVVVPLGVVPTVAGAGLEQFAGHVGKEDVAGVDVFELVQATPSAAVAQRLPLTCGEVLEPLRFPEFVHRDDHTASAVACGSLHPSSVALVIGRTAAVAVRGQKLSYFPGLSLRYYSRRLGP